jgi:hypothetical protein
MSFKPLGIPLSSVKVSSFGLSKLNEYPASEI